ncbi:hypothetical protein HAX54_031848 [Datura stramonium]|uniref:Uncharacterized protein n=1 Tax=Datura stramonium TaxID=4076 RepID=A0ABS8V9U2_DATST|nr:hypothetical protein [Datura stramonium]
MGSARIITKLELGISLVHELKQASGGYLSKELDKDKLNFSDQGKEGNETVKQTPALEKAEKSLQQGISQISKQDNERDMTWNVVVQLDKAEIENEAAK